MTLRALIAPLRLLGLLGLLLIGLPIAALVYPWLTQRRRNRIMRIWSKALLVVCGARLVVSGMSLPPALAATGVSDWTGGQMILANHISWIDVYAMNGALPCRFVAKAEIGQWPVLGWLVTRAGAVYIERGRRHAVASTNHRVRDCLSLGETVAVFPEGTTTDGTTLLPFHSNLVAPALEVGADIWPVALRYTERGEPSDAAAFVGEMSLPQSLWRILLARDLAIEVTLLPAFRPPAGSTRHAVAEQARVAIATHLGLPAEDPRALRREAAARASTQAATARATPADPAPADTAPDAAPDPASQAR